MTPGLEFDPLEFEHRLRHSALSDSPVALHASLLHVLESGGKRVRPVLVYRFGSLCAGGARPVGELALAVEMLHAATLVHDDIIDSAESRRGRTSLHVEHSIEVAILVGDLYVARCGVHLAEAEQPVAAQHVFSALDVMVRGELEQQQRRFDLSQTRDDYLHTIEQKTASLIAAACASSVLVSGGEEAQVIAARTYGRNLGLAFQVIDDVLDYTGTDDSIGKPAASDIREGTVTLPLILAMELSPAPMEAILASARERGDFSAVIQAVRRSGAVERCIELADQLTRGAITALDAFPEGPDRAALEELATSLATRRA
ncbi:MAG: polyprenyl synthetase family protein [Candidatus Dormibacteraeota bacterium]|nr:polyprenyl synthetase family protein [Candidatus Dormibacteraeota bacterium]